MRIYLDTCALNRLTDGQDQPRVQSETAAVERILESCARGLCAWVASAYLLFEISQNRDVVSRDQALLLVEKMAEVTPPSDAIDARAIALTFMGFGRFDAFHLAAAEGANCDALITTDDRFVMTANRRSTDLSIEVMNPVEWCARSRAWLQ